MKFSRQIIFSVCALLISVAALFVYCSNKASVAVTMKQENSLKLPILMYHQVSEKPKKWGKYVVSPDEFEKDIKLILKRGFTPITVNELIAYTEGTFQMPEKPLMITFDDGYESDYVYVLPIVKKYHTKVVSSTVGAYTELYSQNNVPKHINYSHLSWDEMHEMHQSGLFEFQNHSYNLHNFDYGRKGCLKNKDETPWHYEQMIAADFERSQQIFQDHNLPAPTCFTYPFGSTNDELLMYVKTFGFKASLGTYEKVNILTGKPEELYNLKRFNRSHNRDIRKILDQAE